MAYSKVIRARVYLFLIIFLVPLLFPALSYSVSFPTRTSIRTQQLDKEYLAFLIGNKFLLLEIIYLSLAPDGTFSLDSDLYIQPAQGTYTQENAFVFSATGTTGPFLDPEFEEHIEIQYQFKIRPLGLRDRLVSGSGTRKFIFLLDGYTISEKFIFSGFGF